MYKSAAKKMRPVDTDYSDGSVPDGDINWKPAKEAKARTKMTWGGPYDTWVLPRFTDMPPQDTQVPRRVRSRLQLEGVRVHGGRG